VTSSTDGKCMWWDIRKLENGPIETLDVVENQGEEGASLTGATSIEYNNEAGPNKYLVGTE
jgi:dynein intermediate chain 2